MFDISDLKDMLAECKKDLKNLGVVLSPSAKTVAIVINNRAERRYGCYVSAENVIEISHFILTEKTDRLAVQNVVMHELIHAQFPQESHGSNWKCLAARVNRHYPKKYNITRTEPRSNFNLEPSDPMKGVKYAIGCPKCGRRWFYKKKCRAVEHPEYFRCSVCKQPLKRVSVTAK